MVKNPGLDCLQLRRPQALLMTKLLPFVSLCYWNKKTGQRGAGQQHKASKNAIFREIALKCGRNSDLK
jgi:hypothetical protein